MNQERKGRNESNRKRKGKSRIANKGKISNREKKFRNENKTKVRVIASRLSFKESRRPSKRRFPPRDELDMRSTVRKRLVNDKPPFVQNEKAFKLTILVATLNLLKF